MLKLAWNALGVLKISNLQKEKGFKAPVSYFNWSIQENAIESICKYLQNLKDRSHQLLYFYRRKSFILGFVSIAKSIITIVKEVLDRNENSFKYVLT